MRENRVMNDYLFYYIFVDQFIPVSSRFHCTVIVCVCVHWKQSQSSSICAVSVCLLASCTQRVVTLSGQFSVVTEE